MMEEAALEIQKKEAISVEPTKDAYEFNKVKFDPPPLPSDVDSLIKLNRAEKYNQIGTNTMQRDQDMIGTLLDIHI
jgi:hypothetical protein